MKKIYPYLLLVICLGTFSCAEKKSPLNNAMVEATLDDYLQDVAKGFNLEKAVFVHVQYRDVINSFPEGHVSKSVKNPEYQDIISLFEQHKHEPSTLQFNHIDPDRLTIVEDNQDNEKYFKDPAYFGSIYLSNGIQDAAGKMGAYYVALNCGDRCSAGFIIITEMVDGQWKRKDHLVIWESK